MTQRGKTKCSEPDNEIKRDIWSRLFQVLESETYFVCWRKTTTKFGEICHTKEVTCDADNFAYSMHQILSSSKEVGGF